MACNAVCIITLEVRARQTRSLMLRRLTNLNLSSSGNFSIGESGLLVDFFRGFWTSVSIFCFPREHANAPLRESRASLSTAHVFEHLFPAVSVHRRLSSLPERSHCVVILLCSSSKESRMLGCWNVFQRPIGRTKVVNGLPFDTAKHSLSSGRPRCKIA